MAADLRIPFGVEASGYTLETIAAIDPGFLAELRKLVGDGTCEFIGCGFSQVIGPLVPAAVNAANLRIGMETYQSLIGLKPALALVNEQAYAAGLVQLYIDAGYRGIIMEWNNPARAHPEWDPEWRYAPQYALGPSGQQIPVIWNESVAFQKFQRYAHGEIDLDEHLSYLRGHRGKAVRSLSLYGNDVEVFDFRPGRFATEPSIHGEGEWARIEVLFRALPTERGMRMIAPSEVLKGLDGASAGNRLRLESPATPTPVKKQDKYNILRWAVTGRDDLGINSSCWKIFDVLSNDAATVDADWKELCYLWSSDFRTHITQKRWREYQARLARRLGILLATPPTRASSPRPRPGDKPEVLAQNHRLTVRASGILATLNLRRGLAVESLIFPDLAPTSLCGTVPHGTYDDTRFSPDWYTGNVVLEAPAQHKVTDLEPAINVTHDMEPDGCVVVTGEIPTVLGSVHKRIVIGLRSGIELSYVLDWPHRPVGSLRLGFVTLMPGAFDRSTLCYRTHNGGMEPETFELGGAIVDHGAPVSSLVSASQAVGVTESVIEIGDASRTLALHIDKTQSAAVGMVTHRSVGDQLFCQILFSVEEIDDTRRVDADQALPPIRFHMRITARRSGSAIRAR